MSNLDLLAFYKFCIMFTEDIDIIPNKYYYDKFIKFRNEDHLPEDYPMTCNRCIIDECYIFAHELINLTNAE